MYGLDWAEIRNIFRYNYKFCSLRLRKNGGGLQNLLKANLSNRTIVHRNVNFFQLHNNFLRIIYHQRILYDKSFKLIYSGCSALSVFCIFILL